MKKTLMKLSAVGILAMIALVVTVVSTFAWYSVSGTPELGGLQLNIGGTNTIRIAPDITVVTEDGTVHYPGKFSDALNFAQLSSYGYLQDIVSLTPVSTADGIHWFFPGDGSADGDALSGFLMDDNYTYANLSELPDDDAVHGSYVMMDFWVMAPMDCSLRVSYGDNDSGTYVVSLPYPVKNADGKYVLDTPSDILPACVRVGFLADTRTQRDGSMNAYTASPSFDETVHHLKGVYSEPGEDWDYYPTQFTIYEPNADVHSGESVYSITADGSVYRPCEDGSYVKTYPVGYVNGAPQVVDVTDRTTVQTATRWMEENDSLLVQQLFETFMLGEEGVTDPLSLFRKFSNQYLGYRCDAYIEKGTFIEETGALSAACNGEGVADADTLGALHTATATEDVTIVELERNVPQRIRMFVWIEGQDVDCANVIAASGLMINLELAGGND